MHLFFFIKTYFFMKPHHNSEQFVCNIYTSYNSFDLLLRCNVVHIQIKYLFKSHSEKYVKLT